MLRGLLAALTAMVCLLLATSDARAEGALVARGADGALDVPLPLVRTTVEADVHGPVTDVTVTQRFHNSRTQRIEAVYVFPLPTDAAVDAMEMRIGARVLRAQIDRREAARARYEQARTEGRRAALLEQERPNIFTFSVANLDPGADVDVRLHFFGTARYDDHTWEFAMPMVVGPRYIPGERTGNTSGTGSQPDTDRVPDASRITPAYMPPGVRSGHALSVTVRLHQGAALHDVEALAHEVAVTSGAPGEATVTLVDKDEIPNRDFVLRWSVETPAVRASVLAHRADAAHDGYVAVTFEPRHDAPASEIAPRELVFLLDTSGSMQGPPLAAVQAAIVRALTTMSPSDTFQIIDFADTASSLSPTPLRATPENVAQGLAYLGSLEASGGTNQLAGIHAALAMPGDPMRVRYVVFMTDGYIGNESEVIALTQREIGSARIFSFGVGSSVNRYLLEEVALAGRGHAEFLRHDEDPTAAVERLYRRIGSPYLTDVQLEWRGLDVRGSFPDAVPDVSSLEPLTVLARYPRGGTGTLVLRGRLAGRAWSQTVPVTLPEREPGAAALAPLWGRAKIAALTRAQHREGRDTLREEITAVALEHHLVSDYTSFVAVDETPGARGPTVRVVQPAEAPDGVNVRAAGGATFGYGGLGLVGAGEGGSGLGNFGTIGTGTRGGEGFMGRRGGYGHGYGAGALPNRTPAPPRFRADAPVVQGALSTEVVRRVFLRSAGGFRYCYEAALRRNPALSGRVMLDLVIAGTGAVLSASLSQGLAESDVNQCLVQHARRMVFPTVGRGVGTVRVRYPLLFAPPER